MADAKVVPEDPAKKRELALRVVASFPVGMESSLPEIEELARGGDKWYRDLLVRVSHGVGKRAKGPMQIPRAKLARLLLCYLTPVEFVEAFLDAFPKPSTAQVKFLTSEVFFEIPEMGYSRYLDARRAWLEALRDMGLPVEIPSTAAQILHLGAYAA